MAWYVEVKKKIQPMVLVDDTRTVRMINDMEDDEFRNLAQAVRREGTYPAGLIDFLGSDSAVSPTDANEYLVSLRGRVRILAIAALKYSADKHEADGPQYIVGRLELGARLPPDAFEVVHYAGSPMQRQIANQAYDQFTDHLRRMARALKVDPDTLLVRPNTFLNGVDGAPGPGLP